MGLRPLRITGMGRVGASPVQGIGSGSSVVTVVPWCHTGASVDIAEPRKHWAPLALPNLMSQGQKQFGVILNLKGKKK